MQNKLHHKQSLGATLRQARKALGKTQSALADVIGVSVPTIRALEEDGGQQNTTLVYQSRAIS